MKAIRYYGKEDVRLDDDVPEPLVEAGTVKIKPAFTGICGSDLHLYYDGAFPPAPSETEPHPLSGETLPVVFGHEFSGTIEELGAGVSGLTVGEGVVVEPFMVCGECEPCKAGRYNACEKMGFIGISGRGGGMSEHIVVEQRWVHPIGDIPLDQAALIEPTAVAYHGARLAGVKEGDWVVIGGAGPIGLLAAAVVKALGGTAIVSEVSAARKAKARETGVQYVIDPTTEDLPSRVRELTNGRGADAALECAGVQAVFDQLVASLAPGGTMVVIALYMSDPTLPIGPVLFRELFVGGSIGYADDHPRVIELVQQGKIDLAPYITKRIKAADIVAEGFETLRTDKDNQVKILVEM